MIKTQEFTTIVGETYATVRNVYGRPGREPRMASPNWGPGAPAGSHRRYVFADALAWRFARNLSKFSLDWDTAASVVFRERPADAVLKNGDDQKGQFFAVWPVLANGERQWASYRGKPSEIAEIIESDAERAEIGEVLMVSCEKALSEAIALANSAGFDVIDGQLVAQGD